MNKHVTFFLLLLSLSCASFAQEAYPSLKRGLLPNPFLYQDKKFTNVGNIGLTITNYGVVGNGFLYWNEHVPSCEYPKGSRIEHIFLGGLWVGAENRRTGKTSVTTAAIDVGSGGRASEGFEFSTNPEDTIGERSTLSGAHFNADAISNQDFYCDYFDNDTLGIPFHIPLGLYVHQESYAWNYSFADFFVIVSYTIHNAGADTLDSVYVGMWTNPAVRNTNLSGNPSGSEFFRHQGNGFVDSLRMAYTFDFDGQPYGPPADHYVGVKLLGTTPFPMYREHIGDTLSAINNLQGLDSSTYYNAWKFRSGSGDVYYFYPTDDVNADPNLSRYSRLKQSLRQDKIDPLRLSAGNYTNLLSTGPFVQLNPGDSITVVYGFICAKKSGSLLAYVDSLSSRKELYANAGWAQKAYDGEDINENNVLDPLEDLNGNGKLDRYVLPQPPRQPKIRAEVSSQHVVIYWDKETSENSTDPISKTKDFEGYRIYRSNAGADFQNPEDFLNSASLVGEFDRNDDNIGYNTGFNSILLSTPKTFPPDTTKYWYRFPPLSAETTGLTHLNGWQYLYGISAFDKGDSVNKIPSLESGQVKARVIPGTKPTSNSSAKIGVYPNPYYVNAYWDGTGERNRKLMFYNLPKLCTVRIYTLTGDVVAEFEHDATTYRGSDIQWFQQFQSVQSDTLAFSGGEHAWNLVSKFDQALATGLYLFTVEDKENGEIKTGKFVIIK